MAFPSEKELKRVRKILEKAEGTLALAENPTPLQKLRWDICQKFIIYRRENNLSQKQIAELVGTDEAKMSKILHHRIEKFSTDRLLGFYQVLNPEVKIKVS